MHKILKKKDLLLNKFRKHAGGIHAYFKEADINNELEDMVVRLKILITERQRRKKEQVELHAQKHAKLFAKSLDQKLYNLILQDRANYGRDMINLLCICRQLKYETILNSNFSDNLSKTQIEIQFIKNAREFMKPVKFVEAKLKGIDEELPRMPNKNKLWPIITFDMKNTNVLRACFNYIFQCVQKHVEYGQREVVYSLIQSILGKIFKIDTQSILEFKHSEYKFDRELAIQSFINLEKSENQIKEACQQFDYLEENLPDLDPEDLPPFKQSDETMEKLINQKDYTDTLDFANCMKTEGFFCLTRVTKIVLMFVNLYQRLSIFWAIFNQCAKKSEDFDLLKTFDWFRLAAISPIHTIEGSYQAIDPEMTFERIFGNISPLASNISNLVMKIAKNLTFASYDNSVYELTILQQKDNFQPFDAAKWLFKNCGLDSRLCFQIHSYCKVSRKLVIHNIPLKKPEGLEIPPEIINLENDSQEKLGINQDSSSHQNLAPGNDNIVLEQVEMAQITNNQV